MHKKTLQAAIGALFTLAGQNAQAQENILDYFFGAPPPPSPQRMPEDYYRRPSPEPLPVPQAPARKSPHTGYWSSWDKSEPVGGSQKFESGQACFVELSSLVNKFNYEVHLTCEDDKTQRVTVYQVCKPAQTGIECYSILYNR